MLSATRVSGLCLAGNLCKTSLREYVKRLIIAEPKKQGNGHIWRHASQESSRRYSSVSENKLLENIKSIIKARGPMTVAEYMQNVLTHSSHGYYMGSDVFGEKGDFTTSPEISQMFGELIAVWCIHEWLQRGKPRPFQIVEFGPGRGTLADDMLRVFKKHPDFYETIALHLVEISPKLREIQQKKLCSIKNEVNQVSNNMSMPTDEVLLQKFDSMDTGDGVKVCWWKDFAEVPVAPSFYVAHEFFDALPIHKFQKINGKWHEVLVNYQNDELCLVLSRSDTTSTALLKDYLETCQNDHVEISPQSLTLARQIASRVEKSGGFALIVDYGHLGDKGDTFRAFRKHRLVDPLLDPGSSDLTADVNFELLKSQALDKVSVHGPVTQASFLKTMGIDLRLQILMQKANEEQKKDLISGYEMLTDQDKMGERFKFMAFVDKCSSCLPAGFSYSN